MNKARKAANLSIDRHRRLCWLATISDEEIEAELAYRGLQQYREINVRQLRAAESSAFAAGEISGAEKAEAYAMERAVRLLQRQPQLKNESAVVLPMSLWRRLVG